MQTLFKQNELESELSSLDSGAMRDGFAYVYKLWKSLLNKWFSTPGAELYMASPFLDADRLGDIIRIHLQHRATGKLHTFYTRCNCDGSKPTVEVQKDAASKYTSRQKTVIEYEIYRRMVYPLHKFHGKFIASVMGDNAEVLVTSADFNAEHFARENYETVFYVTMSREKFEKEYIEPITSPTVARP